MDWETFDLRGSIRNLWEKEHISVMIIIFRRYPLRSLVGYSANSWWPSCIFVGGELLVGGLEAAVPFVTSWLRWTILINYPTARNWVLFWGWTARAFCSGLMGKNLFLGFKFKFFLGVNCVFPPSQTHSSGSFGHVKRQQISYPGMDKKNIPLYLQMRNYIVLQDAKGFLCRWSFMFAYYINV